jgi:glycolate oxidase FAD binding subunit
LLAENARGKKLPLFPVGGRTSLHYGYSSPQEGRVISTSQLGAVTDYPARDMTITVGAGIRIDRLRELLKAERQQLPVDVSQSQRATLGGVVATNTSGPRRFGYGTMRDYVIGVAAVDASGRLFHAGGRVVKNVAGYDLCKLLVGSLGTLAVMTELTLKLKPIPDASAMLWVQTPTFAELDSALLQLLTSSTRPVSIEVLNSSAATQIAAETKLSLPANGPVLIVEVEGTGNIVGWQLDALKRELEPIVTGRIELVRDKASEALASALVEYQVFSDDPLTFQANLLPSQTMAFVEQASRAGCAVQSHAANGIVVAHLPDDVATAAQAAAILTPLRDLARRSRGSLTIVTCDNDWKRQLPVFDEQKKSWDLMRRVKQTLDPHHLLNPGRFFQSR